MRAVEAARPAGTVEFLYGPGGAKLAVMSGQNTVRADIPLPGGGAAVYHGATLAYYRHADGLGSSRLASTPGGALYAATAYSPYGGVYQEAGAGAPDRNFTGQGQDIDHTLSGGQYDFLEREYSPVQGRWWTPDPAGLAAVNPSNPQSWNRYGYAFNSPLEYVDPDGRDAIMVDFTSMAHGFGHEGIVVVRPDGTATYARFGPVPAGQLWGRGQVLTYNLSPVELGPDGVPTAAAFRQLAVELGGDEHGQDPSTVRMNYFATTDAGTVALDAYIAQTKALSDKGKLPSYSVLECNCANYAVGGLNAAGAINGNNGVSSMPNMLYDQLIVMALESWANGALAPRPPVCVEWNDQYGHEKSCE